MINLTDIKNAQQKNASYLRKTPIIPAESLGDVLDVNLFFKAEVFQHTGSFKPRGSFNKISSLSEADRSKGVITASSGNHAQGCAYAARTYGIPATVVMHKDTSPLKIAKTKKYGAEVILISDTNPFPTTLELARERSMTFIHPFNDLQIITGHGTLGLEIINQQPDIDYIFAPIGGGGLISGLATAVKLMNPRIKVIGVEPSGAPGMWKSLNADAVITLDSIDTIAAGLSPPFVGENSLKLTKRYVDDVILVSDHAIIEALLIILEQTKILTEPSGVASVAGFLSNQVKIPAGSNVMCILSGGNIDRADLERFIVS